MGNYDDMIYLDRPNGWHPKMRRGDRAKLFSPFDALNGFGSAIQEKDIVYVPRMQLSDYIHEGINRKLKALRRRDTVTVIYFVSVQRGAEEDLGDYRTVTAAVIRVDELERKLILDTVSIPFEDIMTIYSSDLEDMEDHYAGIQ